MTWITLLFFMAAKEHIFKSPKICIRATSRGTPDTNSGGSFGQNYYNQLFILTPNF